MILQFTKMHGAGNDFVMIDLVSQRGKLRPRDFRYRIFNADGDEVEQCGNGARCFARFVRERKLTAKRHIRVETCAGILELRVKDRHQVEVDMGVPLLAPEEVPIAAPARSDDYAGLRRAFSKSVTRPTGR